MSHETGREVDTCGLTCEVNHANKNFGCVSNLYDPKKGLCEEVNLCFTIFIYLFLSFILNSRFLPALLTAVLTNHLAWVPTVMPNGQPPIKIFLEKHSSQSVDMLAKTHPYNPLWAQLGEGLPLARENLYVW